MKWFLKKAIMAAVGGLMGSGCLLGLIGILDATMKQLSDIEQEEQMAKKIKEENK